MRQKAVSQQSLKILKILKKYLLEYDMILYREQMVRHQTNIATVNFAII